MATADTTTGPAGIAMPMRDRLLGAVAAASPSSKGKMPLQLPPPPPGMPASQVEKWRKEGLWGGGLDEERRCFGIIK